MRRALWLAPVLLTLWIDALLWYAGDAGPVGWTLSLSIPHVFVLPTLIAAFGSIRKRAWGRTGLNAAVALGQVFGPMGLCLGRHLEGDADLRVLSYNVASFGRKTKRLMATAIGSVGADVVCLQEASYGPKFPVMKEFVQNFKGYHVYADGGMILAAKRPLLRAETYVFPSHLIYFHWNVQEAAIDVKGREVRIVNVHMVPDAWQPPEWPRLPFGESIERKRRLRDEEIDEVLRRVRSRPGPVVVCGDFNQQPFDPRYRRLAAELTDSFRATSTGFGYTLTRDYPTKRVDYVWTKGLRPLRTKVLPLPVSDHMPVLAELAFKP